MSTPDDVAGAPSLSPQVPPATPPRVTVVIPTYNRGPLLRRAIDSVLGQTLPGVELIVLDNASTDETPELLATYAGRLTHVRRPVNIGHLANLSEALHVGSAPYVTVLHDKEEMLPRNLELKVALLDAHPGMVMAHGAFRIVDVDGNPVAPHRRGGPWPSDYVEDPGAFLLRMVSDRGGVRQQSSLCIRRTALEGESFRQDDAPADDVGLWLRLGAKGQVGYTAETTTLLRPIAGWSTNNDYLSVRGGRWYPGVAAARAGADVRRRFLDGEGAALPPALRWRLRQETRAWARRQLASVLRRECPRFQPPRRAASLLGQALRIEPTLPLTPRLLLVLKPYGAVDRSLDEKTAVLRAQT